MQDRYAGDVGDFLKFGLLRQLTAAADGSDRLRLGVVWYLAPNEAHNADGKHVSYLDPSSKAGGALRSLDPDLYERLAHVVANGRSVTGLEAAGVLPPGSTTFRERLSFVDLGRTTRDVRTLHRDGWMQRAAEAVKTADLVFVDPDNGLRRGDHSVQRHRTDSVKHAYLDELSVFTQRGQSVVAYHHADRSATVEVQAQRRMSDVHDELGIEPLAVVRASRGTTRLFVVVARPEHRSHMEDRLEVLSSGPWGRELTVIRPGSAPSVRAPHMGSRPRRESQQMGLTVVDTFTDRPFTGNPAAIAFVDAFPSDERMQAVAREMNLSETAFVVARTGHEHDLRWFTPTTEVDLCGHATLAAAFLIGGRADFHTRSGLLSCHERNGMTELELPRWALEPCQLPSTPRVLADAVWSGRAGSDWLVELPTAAAVADLDPDMSEMAALGRRAVIVTARAEPGEDRRADVVCRVFAPNAGIPEDPATGSAQCALGPYWAERLGRREMVCRQLSARGAVLHTRVLNERVAVGGHAIAVSEVRLLT